MRVADRLRELIDLVLDSLDEPGTGGAALAQRAQAPARGLGELGARVPSPGDPLEWEAGRQRPARGAGFIGQPAGSAT